VPSPRKPGLFGQIGVDQSSALAFGERSAVDAAATLRVMESVLLAVEARHGDRGATTVGGDRGEEDGEIEESVTSLPSSTHALANPVVQDAEAGGWRQRLEHHGAALLEARGIGDLELRCSVCVEIVEPGLFCAGNSVFGKRVRGSELNAGGTARGRTRTDGRGRRR
jgi:hypothetical protein